MVLALAAAAPGAAEEGDRTRVLLTVASSYAHRAGTGALTVAPALARDFPFELGSRFVLSGELYPVLLFRQGTNDGTQRVNLASGAGLLFCFRGGSRTGVGFRVEAGSGVSWAYFRALPVDGTRFNFLSQGGASVSFPWSGTRAISIGYRWMHISNLSLYGTDNPGLSSHAVSLGVEWR